MALTVKVRDPATAEAGPNERAFQCPGCGADYLVVGDDAEAPMPGRVLHFDFACEVPDCDYVAGMGLG